MWPGCIVPTTAASTRVCGWSRVLMSKGAWQQMQVFYFFQHTFKIFIKSSPVTMCIYNFSFRWFYLKRKHCNDKFVEWLTEAQREELASFITGLVSTCFGPANKRPLTFDTIEETTGNKGLRYMYIYFVIKPIMSGYQYFQIFNVYILFETNSIRKILLSRKHSLCLHFCRSISYDTFFTTGLAGWLAL